MNLLIFDKRFECGEIIKMRGNCLCEITTCSVWYIDTYGTLVHMVQCVPIWYNCEGFEFLYPLVQWLATFFTPGSIG